MDVLAMSDVWLPIVNQDGLTEVVSMDRDSLSPGDLARADSFLDTVQYYLEGPEEHPHRQTEHTLDEYEGSNVAGYELQTSADILDDLYNSGEINPAEDHSQ